VGANPKRFVVNAEQRDYSEHKWGYEDWIWNGRYCAKKVGVHKNKECAFHYHKVKDEVIYLQSGKIILTYGWDEDVATGATLTMAPDMAFHIPPGMWHKFHGLEESVVFELSTHHSAKDIIFAGDADDARDSRHAAEDDADS
jgi:mannose-6-phosphate isomerase-like protein (cupin superfamily)